MAEISMLTTFLGWCSVINLGVFIVSSVVLMLAGNQVASIHGKLFGIDKAGLPTLYFQYLGNYKLAIIMLNLVPYVALKLMSQ